jgi:hypothetical protein
MSTTQVYLEIRESINSGTVFSLPRERLEQFVAALSEASAFTHFSAPEFPGTCETIRMALSMRVSEDANLQAKRESRIALIVSSAALGVGLVAAISASWPLVFPSPTQVYATPQKPVHTVQTEQLSVAPLIPDAIAPSKPSIPQTSNPSPLSVKVEQK